MGVLDGKAIHWAVRANGWSVEEIGEFFKEAMP